MSDESSSVGGKIETQCTTRHSFYQSSLSLNVDRAVPTTVGLEIWDTLGQERHSSLVTSFYKNSSGVMIVYDVTNMESFMNLKAWLIELEDKHMNLPQDETYILVGNKSDLENER